MLNDIFTNYSSIIFLIPFLTGIAVSALEYFLTERFDPIAFKWALKSSIYIDGAPVEFKDCDGLIKETKNSKYVSQTGKTMFYLKSGSPFPVRSNMSSWIPFYRGMIQRIQEKWLITIFYPTGLYLTYIWVPTFMLLLCIRWMIIKKTLLIGFFVPFALMLLLFFVWRSGIRKTINGAREILDEMRYQ